MDPIEKIKQKIDIVDLISDYINLKKTGQNFKALCPFHKEKTPSFVVSAERQVWHCFGCHKGGDHFTFIEEIESIDFSESLKMLADKAGVKLTSAPFRTQFEQEKNIFYEINHIAAQFYNFVLTKHKAGRNALSYLSKKRAITSKLIDTFLLGYAPNTSDSLVNYLEKKKGYGKKQIVDSGLATARGNRIFDFFRDRIIFPIYDSRGNVIGFSGRVIDEGRNPGPKYINTRETLIYKKAHSLYGIHFTKEGIRNEGKAIIVEGEFDVLSSIANGISNVVAIKGSALTEEQINLLKRYTKKFVFCLDTDMAGVEAQKRSIQMIESAGIVSSVVIPPHGKDPDELLRTSPNEFKMALRNEVGVYDFVIDQAVKGEDAKSVEGKRSILDKTLPFLRAIDNEIVKEHYVKKLSGILNTSFESVAIELEKIPLRMPKPMKSTPQAVISREDALGQSLLALIIQSENPYEALMLVKSFIKPSILKSQSLKRVFEELINYFKTSNKFDPNKFSKQLTKELEPTFNLAYLKPLPKFESEIAKTKELERTVKEIMRLFLKQRLRELSDKMKNEEESGNDKSVKKLQEEFTKAARQLKEFSSL